MIAVAWILGDAEVEGNELADKEAKTAVGKSVLTLRPWRPDAPVRGQLLRGWCIIARGAATEEGCASFGTSDEGVGEGDGL